MVVYKLACTAGHSFEGWYASLEAFDARIREAAIECPLCGTSQVRKLPSAPYVNTGATPPAHAEPNAAEAAQGRALEALRTYLVTNTENVGRQFPEIARRIHHGEEAQRGIRGQVTRAEAEELREEGVPAYPILPGIALDEVH